MEIFSFFLGKGGKESLLVNDWTQQSGSSSFEKEINGLILGL